MYGHSCWLGLPGCTGLASEYDHIIPYASHGKTTVANLRPACKHCNSSRSNRVLSGYGASIHCIIGPPCSGKSTYVRQHQQPGDIVLDWDALALAMDSGFAKADYSPALASAVTAAWQGAYYRLVRLVNPVSIWIIKSVPFTKAHPSMLSEWVQLGYDIHVCEGESPAVVLTRLATRNEGAKRTAQLWWSLRLTQSIIDARIAERRKQLARFDLARESCKVLDRSGWLD